jgi:hypothetical protein
MLQEYDAEDEVYQQNRKLILKATTKYVPSSTKLWCTFCISIVE